MIRLDGDQRISWREGMTIAHLLRHVKDNRSFVGAVISGRYVASSHFPRTKIPDGAEVRMIPWQEGMTIAELLKYEIDEPYFSSATVDRRLVTEADFDDTVIPKDAEVWLLTPVGGG